VFPVGCLSVKVLLDPSAYWCSFFSQLCCCIVTSVLMLTIQSVALFLHAKAATAFSMSWPSQFCPSVRLSHGWIRQKRSKLLSPHLHRWLL